MLSTETESAQTIADIELKETIHIDPRTQSNIDILRQFAQGDVTTAKAYSGFGGLRKALKQEETQMQLAEFLSPKEIKGLIKSATTGFFTPPILIDFMYQLIAKLGFTHGKILEPACGHGAFFERMPKAMREKSALTGIEFEKVSADIAEALYPDITIHHQGFQHFHDNEFDLIIGNPPYATFSVFDRQHPDLRDQMIHHYFVAKSVRLLKDGGLLAMVVPYYVLDKVQHHARHHIAEVADLVAAYRMPNHLFTDATVTVDVVIFQRRAHPKKDWIDTVLVDLGDKHRFAMAKYFVDRPEQVLGELDTYTAYSFFDNRPRRGLNCAGSVEDIENRLPALINALEPLA